MSVVQRIGVVVAMGAIGCGGTTTSALENGPPEVFTDAGSAMAPPSMAPAPINFGDASVVRPPVPSGPPGVVTFNDAAASVNPNADYSVTLAMTPFTVPAGGEVFKCQDFANPFQGQAVDITQYDLVMSSGSHHMLLFYAPGASDGPVTDCGGLQLSPFTFGSQSPMATEKYPDGVGAAIPAGMGFSFNSHFINSSASAIVANVKVTMYVARPGVVTQHAGSLMFVLMSISIPPTGQPATVSGSCNVSQDMNLISTGAHMHQRATHFVATSGNTTLYQTDVWSDPPMMPYSPPLLLKANSTVDWSCTYVNDTGSTLSFGQSAVTNAMCNFNARFYPVRDVSNPLVQCLQ
jgi:hypothetical protein